MLFMTQLLLPFLCTVEHDSFMQDGCYSTISDSPLAMGSPLMMKTLKNCRNVDFDSSKEA